MKRRIKFQLMTATIVLLIALVGGSFYMIEYSLRRHFPDKFSRETRFTHVVSGNPEIKPWVDSLQKYKLIHDTIVKMQNNERQHAMFVYANLPTTKTAVLLHGYHDNGTKMMQIAHIYAQMGYNLMIPDHHAHGESEGKMIQMARMFDSKISLKTLQMSLNTTLCELLLWSSLFIFLVLSNNSTLISENLLYFLISYE